MSVGKNIRHDSARGHVTGESIFIDDRAEVKNEVHVGYLGSPVSHGRLKGVDFSKALELDDVVAIYTAKDLHHNRWGAIVPEQPILVDDVIGFMDEPVCVIAAETREAIIEARKLIKLDIEELAPIYTIDEAIEKDSFCYVAHPFRRGDVKKTLENSEHILKGHFECGGQEHFYLESQASLVYPMENGQLEVHSSSQHPTETQHLVAEAVGVGFHEVVCEVKRMGGGFGGKESQAAPFAAYAALAAKNLKRPARIVLSKDDDMKVTGKRHPFKNFYEVGFDKDGRITGLDVKIFANAGAYSDLSSSILERAMFHVDGAYFIENVNVEGKCCRTNQHSNTAFRGFGGPQGNMTMESILEDIAIYLKKDAYEVRRINCYGIDERNITPYGQEVEHNKLPELFDEILEYSDYKRRLKEIEVHNNKMTGTLRGISCTAMKFGIAFTAKFLNQGNALVNLHLDGTVQASTGATEMGQGVNTKIQQVVAHAFGINTEKVKVMTTSTEKNHNTSPTAASSGADINCGAALKACNMIKDRLRQVAHKHFNGVIFDAIKEYEMDMTEDLSHIIFKDNIVSDAKTNKEIELLELIKIAYLNRVALGDYAFFKTEGLGFDKIKGHGKAFNYFTNGVAVSEVVIDEYTGDSKVVRADVLMDLGRSINPGIDQGQVTGAFVQGMGWVTTENLFYNEKGNLISHSPTTYKIPNVQDTPREFNVKLIENNDNDVNVHRSKAVGEPPFLLGSSVWTAIKHGLSFRAKNDLRPDFTSPATGETVLMELDRLRM